MKGPAPSPIRWDRYINEVIKFDQHQLLALIGRLSSEYRQRQIELDTSGLIPGGTQPFALAAVARDAILSGFAAASLRPYAEDVIRLSQLYMNLEDPLHDSDADDRLHRFLVRMAYEQFPFQQSVSTEISRSWAMFAETAEMVGAQTMTDRAWREALGCALDEYLRLVFALTIAASANSGWISVADIARPEIRLALNLVHEPQITNVVRAKLADDIKGLRSDLGNAPIPEDLRRYRYNPLQRRPMVQVGTNYLAPVLQILEQKATPSSLYYERCTDPGFTDDLGTVAETYVGRQLKQLDPHVAQVVEKVMYDRYSKESVDWFVVFDEIVLLVEVKATRMPAGTRLGTETLVDAIGRTLGVAYDQLARSAELIRLRREEFRHIPGDRPMLGLAVTLEPYWLIAPGVDPPVPDGLPVAHIHFYELEAMVSAALAGPVADSLLALTDEDELGSRRFSMAFEGKPFARNPILDAALDRVLPS
jgi:hypothetical protein